MSFTDPQADPVQPETDEGQGDAGTEGDAPYADYLARIPEEVRGDVEPVFKDWDSNVTRRFQEAAEYRKSWEPFEQSGVNQLPPEEVAYLVQLRQAMDDPQTMQQWWDGYAQQNGLTQTPQQQPEEQTPPAQDDFGTFQDPQQQLEQLLSGRLDPLQQQVQQLAETLGKQQQQHAEQQALKMIEGQMDELKAKHGDEFSREAIEMFIPNFIESQPERAVPLAFEAYQNMRNQIEKAALQAKADAPAPAEGGGVPDVTPEKVSDFKQAEEIAKTFLRNANRA